LSQSIHTYQGITDWQSFLNLFDEDKRAYFQLDVSYRSTMEIIEFANNIIRPFKQFILAKPVFRSGEPVRVEHVAKTERIDKIVQTIEELRGQANTIAVVGRTEKDCARLHKELQKAGLEANRIQAKDQKYVGGISVIPVYLTKGLEFDAVILVDVDEENYNNSPLSAKLLYVGCTRALHKLYVFYSGTISPLLDFVNRPAEAVTA
jgi:DNA helicase-2/ATP-dependent DNA helicase PcrA